jgi:hypothetical protein
MTDHDPILDAARRLRRDVQPPRDLWPGIAQRLDEPAASPPRPRREPRRPAVPTAWQRRWHHLGSGLALAAAVIALVIFTRPGPSPAPSERAIDDLVIIDAAYQSAREDLADLLDARCQEWPATACAPLLDSAESLDRSAATLRTALASLPADSPTRAVLVERYRGTLDRTRDLTSRVAQL